MGGIFCLPRCQDFVDRFVGNALDKMDIDDRAKDILKGMDSVTLLATMQNIPSVMKKNEAPKTDSDVKTKDVDLGWQKDEDSNWQKQKMKIFNHKISKNFSTEIIGADDLFTKYTFIERLTGRVLRNRSFFPLGDKEEHFASIEDANHVMEQLKFTEGQAFPVSYNQDFNMATDESFSRVFFYGIGCTLVEALTEVSSSEYGPFEIDMPLQTLEMRRNYRPMGCRVHFDAEQKPTAIYDYAQKQLYKPGDDGWAEAKLLAKMTCFTLVTAREHLVWTHLIMSNAATRESTLHLPPSHPIRRLLTIFTFGSNEVNLSAFDMLVPKTCLLHRSLGLKYKSMQQVFDSAYTTSNVFEPFGDRSVNPAVEKLVKDGKFPYFSEGKAYFEIVRNFVTEWMEQAGEAARDEQALAFYTGMQAASKGQKYELPKYSGPRDMINLVSQIIFTVTGYHEIVGHVVDYTIQPDRAGFRITKDKRQDRIDIQSFIIAANISASTSVRMPQLCATFENYFAVDAPAWERPVWDDFVSKLDTQSEVVRAADEKRINQGGVEFKYFDPARFECSVSV